MRQDIKIKTKKTVVLAGPFSPPITGNSLPFDTLCKHLRKHNTVLTINFSCRLDQTLFTFFRKIFHRIMNIKKITKQCAAADIVYYSLAESAFGILRDFVTFSFCYKYLHKFYLHIFGGCNLKKIIEKPCSFYRYLAPIYFKRIQKIFCEGNEQKKFLRIVTPPKKIVVVPNFFSRDILLPLHQIRRKNKNSVKVLLFLSNFLPGKGYRELLEAYASLPKYLINRTELHFAGAFASKNEKKSFLSQVSKTKNVFFHGIVCSKKKYNLFKKAHIFCLPTYYAYEGQPFVIFEAYASGCFVITTKHMGIPSIFKDNINGKFVKKKSVKSLRNALIRTLLLKYNVEKVSLKNNFEARVKYSEQKFVQKICGQTGC